ncbi:uncharacterized protein LOC132549341 [Ylistrum balloti]|uniref:uncharacterized protein LOC132549341 n=1 Tax=Ylistrum balloti TaxID=509963 RepID=UPI002905CE87|nr:uncharacterized protein LOC132549341 [Ylistrum balloti]
MSTTNVCYDRLKCLFWTSFVINFILVAALLILFIIHQQLQNGSVTENVTSTLTTGALRDSTGELCLPCDYQGQTLDNTLYETILKTENNDTVCCLARDEDLQNLILEVTNKGNLRWWTERNYAAHLYRNDLYFGEGVSWTQEGKKTSLLRNLTLTDEGRQLAVPTMPGAGTYFVYALYTFDFSKASPNRPDPIGVHSIFKHRSGFINGKRQRLWTAKTGGANTAKRQTSFLCGIVNMNMRDTLESEAFSYIAGEKQLTLNYIDRSPYSNYFGMFKLIEFA